MTKKHYLVTLLGRQQPACGRNLSRPQMGAQVQSTDLSAASAEVDCSWCLKKMHEQGLYLTNEQMVAMAKPSRARDTAEELESVDDIEEEDDGQ